MSNSKKSIIIAAAACIITICSVYFTDVPSELQRFISGKHTKKRKKVCGQYCLASILRTLGKNVTAGELLPAAQPEYGTNLAQLKALAQEYGLKALGANVSMETLFSMKCAAILHVNGDHFIAFLPRKNENTITVYDPPKEFIISGSKELTKRWNFKGNCLFIDEKEINLQGIDIAGGIPRIYVENPVYDAGIIFDNTKIINPTFTIENKGSAELVIEDIKTGCSCTTAKVEKEKIAPGESTELKLRYKVAAYLGKMPTLKAVLKTNDPEHPVMTFKVKGIRKREFIFDPPRAAMGLLKLGREKIILMKIVPGSEDRRIFPDKAEISSPFIELSQVKNKYANPNPNHYLLKICLSPNTPPGPFDESIRIPCDGSSYEILKIPVTAEIVGPVRLSLTEIQFGLINQNSKAATKNVHLKSDEPFNIAGLKTTQPWLETENKKVSETKYIVTIKITPAQAPEGKLNAAVILRTNSSKMPEIRIPVYAYRL